MKLKGIIRAILILMTGLLRIIWQAWRNFMAKAGTGLMTTFGMGKISGIEGVMLRKQGSVEQAISCTEPILLDGTRKTITHMTGSLSEISKEPLGITNTLKPGNTLYATSQESSIYDVHLILKLWTEKNFLDQQQE